MIKCHYFFFSAMITEPKKKGPEDFNKNSESTNPLLSRPALDTTLLLLIIPHAVTVVSF